MFGNGLAGQGGDVCGAKTVIDFGLQIVICPLGTRAPMSHVCGDADIASSQRLMATECSASGLSAEAAAANSQELTVPVRDRKQEFDADAGCDIARHLAIGRNLIRRPYQGRFRYARGSILNSGKI